MKKLLYSLITLAAIYSCGTQAKVSSTEAFAQSGNFHVIGFYNLENLFDTYHDEGKNDYEFLPDGANEWTILFRIITPLILPSVAVVALYYAVSHWNSWFNAMLFIKDRKYYPLQLILREILILSDTDEGFMMSETIQFATIVVATIPILCVYPFIQRYFVKGIMVGAVKG